MHKIILLLFCLLFCNIAVADNNRGVSFILQMCSKNAKQQKKFFNQVYKNADVRNAGWMYGNTSNPNGCTWSKAFMKQNKKKRVRVHICNSTCFKERGRTCQPNECFPNLTAAEASKKIIAKDKATYKRIDNIIALAKNDYNVAPKGTVIDYAVSPCLECTLSLEARKTLMNYVVNKFKDIKEQRESQKLNPIKFVDNPMQGSCMSGYLCEKHGNPSVNKTGIADNDGLDYDAINQIDYFGRNTKAWMVLAWKPCLNGLTGKEGSFVKPQDRSAYCDINRDAPEFALFTDKNFSTEPTVKTNNNDLKGCKKVYTINKNYSDKNFVWKLGEGKKYTVWIAPNQFNKFSKVQLIKDRKIIDSSYPQLGYRFGQEYAHDTGKKRRIYDFRKHPATYPDNAVLHADDNCFIFPKTAYRPFSNPNASWNK